MPSCAAPPWRPSGARTRSSGKSSTAPCRIRRRAELDFAQFGRLSASGIDPEEVFRRDKLESVIERHDKGAEVARSGPSLSSPPQHLNLVAVAGWPQAGNGVRRLESV